MTKPSPTPEPPERALEQAILGGMMMQNDAPIEQGLRRLHSKVFERDGVDAQWHKDIFLAIRALDRKRKATGLPKVVDIIAVHEEMASTKRLKANRMPGAEYLKNLVLATPCSANVEYYIDRLLEFSRRRYLRAVVMAAADATERGCQAGVIIDGLSAALVHIAERGWCEVDGMFG